MNYDYAIHSDFLIHWTGKDIDEEYDKHWYDSDKSKTSKTNDVSEQYLNRLLNTLKYGLWMTEEDTQDLLFDGTNISVPKTPKTCFTELKVSESRKHARQYGRLGIGFKRPFVFKRFGRPLVYYGFHDKSRDDKFFESCAKDLSDKNMLNFFKPMNSTSTLNYDFYGESEWSIIFLKDLLSKRLIIDPRDNSNTSAHAYFNSLSANEQDKLKYLIPLDGWFAMIIYPSLDVKNMAQQDTSKGILGEIKRIKELKDHGNAVEKGNRPIEVDLDACRNF